MGRGNKSWIFENSKECATDDVEPPDFARPRPLCTCEDGNFMWFHLMLSLLPSGLGINVFVVIYFAEVGILIFSAPRIYTELNLGLSNT